MRRIEHSLLSNTEGLLFEMQDVSSIKLTATNLRIGQLTLPYWIEYRCTDLSGGNPPELSDAPARSVRAPT